jgi:hypothetical protein
MEDNETGKWAIVSLSDGMTYEGRLSYEADYGIYIHIAGDETRLSLFPWYGVSRVVYKSLGY